jgi:hypothetical protein
MNILSCLMCPTYYTLFWVFSVTLISGFVHATAPFIHVHFCYLSCLRMSFYYKLHTNSNSTREGLEYFEGVRENSVNKLLHCNFHKDLAHYNHYLQHLQDISYPEDKCHFKKQQLLNNLLWAIRQKGLNFAYLTTYYEQFARRGWILRKMYMFPTSSLPSTMKFHSWKLLSHIASFKNCAQWS